MNPCALFLALSPDMLPSRRRVVLCPSYSPKQAYQRQVLPGPPPRVVGTAAFRKKEKKKDDFISVNPERKYDGQPCVQEKVYLVTESKLSTV